MEDHGDAIERAGLTPHVVLYGRLKELLTEQTPALLSKQIRYLTPREADMMQGRLDEQEVTVESLLQEIAQLATTRGFKQQD